MSIKLANIDWHCLKKGAKEIIFENFCYQIAYSLYSEFGDFEYCYQTPGSEFYLTVAKKCEELKVEKGDVVGWQSKFWVNEKAPDNSSLNASNRKELIANFKKTLKYKSNIKTWIVCTPGQVSDTAPSKPKTTLISELKKIKKDINIKFWSKDKFESFYTANFEQLHPIFCHYFEQPNIGFDYVKDFSNRRIERLENKFDSDLYTSGEYDMKISKEIDIENGLKEIIESAKQLKNTLQNLKISDPGRIRGKKIVKKNYWNNVKKLLEVQKKFAFYAANCLIEYGNVAICKNICNEFLVNQKESGILLDLLNNLHKSDEYKDEGELEDEEHEVMESLKENFNELSEKNQEIYNSSKKIIRRHLHLFGKAGAGKTNIACNICKELLAQGRPAILFLASDFCYSIPIKEQITKQISTNLEFPELLGALNNLGFIYKQKVPFIIDGLNEVMPTANIWQAELPYLLSEFEKYDFLELITTCRDQYTEQIFKKKNPQEIDNGFVLEGFTEENIDIAIKKYFVKYRIKSKGRVRKDLLKNNPLFLRILCTVNEGKTISVNENNIWNSIDRYIDTLLKEVSMKEGMEDVVLKSRLEGMVKNVCQKIWDDGSRSLLYVDDFFPIFDADRSGEVGSLSRKVIEEGIFIRGIPDGKNEHIEFTFDFLAGFCIAKHIFFDNKSALKKDLLQDKELKHLLKHPLKEDIIRALHYLCAKIEKKQLFELVSDPEILKISASMVDFISSTKEGKKSLLKIIDRLSVDDPIIQLLLENLFEEIIKSYDYSNLDILIHILERMSSQEINLYWGEMIRRFGRETMLYLSDIEERLTKGDAKSAILFISLFLVSTNKELRDTATEKLVKLVEFYPHNLIGLLNLSLEISDIYIMERVFAVTCGVLLRKNNKSLTILTANHVRKIFCDKIEITHILIMDYIYTIFEFAREIYGWNYDKKVFLKNKKQKWEKDIDCMKNNRGEFGYKFVSMDVAKNHIKYISGGVEYKKIYGINTPDFIDCLSMIVWKAKETGYEDSVFGDINKKIIKNNNDYRYYGKAESYGEKYSWIAYYELYGYFVINKLIGTEYGYGFRVSDVNIDTSFPVLERKEQVFKDCLLPYSKETAKKWTKRKVKYLDEINKIKFIDNSQSWILLRSRHWQEDKDNHKRIDIIVNSYLIEGKASKEVLKHIQKKGYNYGPEDKYYIFGGEISWSKKTGDREIKITLDGKDVSLYRTCSFYSWESHHSVVNKTEGFPFLSLKISQELGLKFNVNDCNYTDKNDDVCVRLVHDSNSQSLFIKEEILNQYLKDKKLTLVWKESISKYGSWGKTVRDSLYKDFVSIKVL